MLSPPMDDPTRSAILQGPPFELIDRTKRTPNPAGNVVAILGPTGVGKTRVAAAVARELGGEVLVADSRQVYRRLDIATNKPLPEEAGGVPFNLIDLAEPDEAFNAHLWVRAAEAGIEDLTIRGKVAVIEGGTMLWVDALLDGLNLAGVPPDPLRRSELERVGP